MSRNPKKRTRAEAGVDYQDGPGEANSKRIQDPYESDILRFLDAHAKEEVPRRKANKELKLKAPSLFSLSTQALVIYLRFGTISNDSQKWLSPKEVLYRTGVKPSAQTNLIKRWK
jgi:hypothetical protein